MGQVCFTTISSNRARHHSLHCSQFSVPDLCVRFPSVQWLGSGKVPSSLFHSTRSAVACRAVCDQGGGVPTVVGVVHDPLCAIHITMSASLGGFTTKWCLDKAVRRL